MQKSTKKLIIFFFLFLYVVGISVFVNHRSSNSVEKVHKRIQENTYDFNFISTLRYFKHSLEGGSSGASKATLNNFFKTHPRHDQTQAIVVHSKKERKIVSFAIVKGSKAAYSSLEQDLILNDLDKSFIINNFLFIPVASSGGDYTLIGVLSVDRLINEVPGVVNLFQNLAGNIEVEVSFWRMIYDFLSSVILTTIMYLIMIFLILKLIERTFVRIENEKNKRYLALLSDADEIKYDVLNSLNITNKFFTFIKQSEVSKEIKGWLSFAESHHIYAHQLMSDLDQFKSEVKACLKEGSLHDICKKISHELEIISEGKTTINLQLKHNCQVYLDAVKIERVLRNLVRNAHHHTKDCLSTREVWIETSEDSLGSITITVGNTNSLILFKNIETIFDKRFSTGKTGYGLLICKKIIEAHKSELLVRSDRKSTEFSFKLEGVRNVCTQ